MKRLLFSFIMALLPFVANAEYVEIDGFYYDLGDTYATLTYKHWENNCYWGTVTIPESVTYQDKTYTVKYIGKEAFKKCTALISITIPNTITDIGNNVFEGCSALTSISIPGNVLFIGTEVFKGCENLRDVSFCDGKEELSISTGEWLKQMFNDCPLKSLYLGRNINYDGNERFIISPRDGHLGLFGSNTLECITFGNYVTDICYMAFAGCKNIKNISIPSDISTIGKGAFAYCI